MFQISGTATVKCKWNDFQNIEINIIVNKNSYKNVILIVGLKYEME